MTYTLKETAAVVIAVIAFLCLLCTATGFGESTIATVIFLISAAVLVCTSPTLDRLEKRRQRSVMQKERDI